MPLIVKRGLRETWREAVARRAGRKAEDALARYDARLADHPDEAEAAYRVLAELGLLWRVDEPGVESAPVAEKRAAG